MEWITANAVALLALFVSALSSFVSWRTWLNVSRREKVTGWIDLAATGDREYFRATLRLKNPSPYDIRLEKLAVDLPDFRLVDIGAASVDDGAGNRVLPEKIRASEYAIAMEVVRTLQSGASETVSFLLYQPAHSRRRGTKVRVMYWRLGPKKSWTILPIAVTTRGSF